MDLPHYIKLKRILNALPHADFLSFLAYILSLCKSIFYIYIYYSFFFYFFFPHYFIYNPMIFFTQFFCFSVIRGLRRKLSCGCDWFGNQAIKNCALIVGWQLFQICVQKAACLTKLVFLFFYFIFYFWRFLARLVRSFDFQ